MWRDGSSSHLRSTSSSPAPFSLSLSEHLGHWRLSPPWPPSQLPFYCPPPLPLFSSPCPAWTAGLSTHPSCPNWSPLPSLKASVLPLSASVGRVSCPHRVWPTCRALVPAAAPPYPRRQVPQLSSLWSSQVLLLSPVALLAACWAVAPHLAAAVPVWLLVPRGGLQEFPWPCWLLLLWPEVPASWQWLAQQRQGGSQLRPSPQLSLACPLGHPRASRDGPAQPSSLPTLALGSGVLSCLSGEAARRGAHVFGGQAATARTPR